jgi:hypothetical protein
MQRESGSPTKRARRKSMKVRKAAVCRDLDEEDKTACFALSRLVSRGMHEKLKEGTSLLDVCQRLQEQNPARHPYKLSQL